MGTFGCLKESVEKVAATVWRSYVALGLDRFYHLSQRSQALRVAGSLLRLAVMALAGDEEADVYDTAMIIDTDGCETSNSRIRDPTPYAGRLHGNGPRPAPAASDGHGGTHEEHGP